MPSRPEIYATTTWTAHCTVCGPHAAGATLTGYPTEHDLLTALTTGSSGWALRDDGRILCRQHNQLADCAQRGHELLRWRAHPLDDALQWRYCRRCGNHFEQRITDSP